MTKLLFSILILISINLYAMKEIETEKEIQICPSSPNCVSSMTKSADHKMDAINIEGNEDEVYEKVRSVVLKMNRTKEIKNDHKGLHFTFTSLIFRFTDDVYFYFDKNTSLLHFKSQSRVGYSDLGANKKRMEAIASQLESK